MKSSYIEIEQLKQRFDNVEKQNLRFKKITSVLCLLLLTFFLVGFKTALQDGHFKNITAEGVTIVNSAGEKLVFIGTTNDGAGMDIFNKSGKRVVSLGITKDESGSGFLVADNSGMPRIGLGMEKEIPSIAIADANGKKIIGIGGGQTGYGVAVMDKNEVERVGIGFQKGNSGFMIFNDQGRYVRGMIRQKDGVHYTSYVDENGKEIINR
jgi:hypothetical protein